MSFRVAIVGAGISGLSTHWFLEREAARAGRGIEVETWDPKPEPGGNVRTESRDGWRCEEAAESVLNSRTETRALAEEIGLGDRIVQVSPLARKRFLVWNGKLRAMGPGAVFGSFPTWSAKLAALREPFVAKGPDDESVADFGRRRLGDGLFEQIMDPMVTGIYAANPERLSVLSAFPRIKAMEASHASLVRAMWAKRKDRASTPKEQRAGSGSYSFAGGMSDLVRTLASSVRGPVRRGERALSIEHDGDRWLLRGAATSGEFDRVVLAVPAHQIHDLQGIPADVRKDLESVPFNPVAVVGLGFARGQVSHPLDGFGFLVPRLEKRKILGTLFTSSLWPDVAPEGHVLLRTMVGGGRNPELARLPREELVELVRQELADLVGARGEPVFVHVRAYEHGIPEYPVGHQAMLRSLKERLRGTGLHLAGNSWDGIGLNDCVAAALPRAREMLG